MEADLVYFRRRSAEEARAAGRALDVRVRDVHLDLSRRYQERAAELEARQLDPRGRRQTLTKLSGIQARQFLNEQRKFFGNHKLSTKVKRV
jgi:hypothetical protein